MSKKIIRAEIEGKRRVNGFDESITSSFDYYADFDKDILTFIKTIVKRYKAFNDMMTITYCYQGEYDWRDIVRYTAPSFSADTVEVRPFKNGEYAVEKNIDKKELYKEVKRTILDSGILDEL